MRRLFGSKFTGVLLAVAGCVVLASCATPTTVASEGFIANASYAIRAAEERGAADFAPNELNSAGEKLAEARKAFSANQKERATRLAQEAVADAMLAEALAAEAGAERGLAEAKKVVEENKALKLEVDRAIRE